MICLIHCGSTWFVEIERNLEELGQKYITFSVDEIGEKAISEEDLEKFKGVIISGGPSLLSKMENRQEFLERFQFVKNYQVPTLGICLGHQILGLLFGGKVANLGKYIKGRETVKILQNDGLLAGLPLEIDFHQDHEEWVSVPENFDLLADSKTCENEAMVCPERKFFGVQFHPETSGTQGKILFKNFIKIIDNANS